MVRAAAVPVRSPSVGYGRAAGFLLLGSVLTATMWQTWLQDAGMATAFVSRSTHVVLLQMLGSTPAADQASTPVVPWWPLFFVAAVTALSVCMIGGWLVSWRLKTSLATSLGPWAAASGLWCTIYGCWEVMHVICLLLGIIPLAHILEAIPSLWTATCFAGVAASFARLWERKTDVVEHSSRWLTTRIAIIAAIYTVIFVTMNWRLWFNLFIPHGDSAMYEEHLWNLLHGKGFRSYLDQGLFLGEHIQVIHLALLPLYVLWPSHLLLELCESMALASGAFPVAWMTLRHTQSSRLACCAATAYLLYFPTQFLDIEIDLKTFRPEAFGIPLLLLTLDQLDRGRWCGTLVGLAACLTVKEDYAIILSPLGLWIAVSAWRQPSVFCSDSQPSTLNPQRRWLLTGLVLTLFGVFYLWFATRIAIPWFRPGEEVHYTRYFSRFGETPEQILTTFVTRPRFVASQLLTLSTLLYALTLLVPVGWLPLASLGRSAVGLPLFGLLCLNELAQDPRHHFHAPLVPIIFWATAAGLGHIPALWQRWWKCEPTALNTWLVMSAACSGLFFSLSPLGVAFWDPGSTWNWQRLYGPNPRGVEFAKVLPQIPLTARVASTDFVHPRFTHHARSYDYSQYVRKVSNYEARVPDDTEYIVIDTTHPYSEMHRPEDVHEYHDTQHWELLPDQTNGYYIILKRK